jgi:hypothetical protein
MSGFHAEVRYAELRRAVLYANSPVDKTRAYRELFAFAGPPELRKLEKDTDIGIALQSRWERCRRNRKPKDNPQARKRDAEHFFRDFKMLTGVQPPGWWRELVESAFDSESFTVRRQLPLQRMWDMGVPPLRGNDVSFRAMVESIGGFPYLLRCIETTSGRIRWTRTVWAIGRTFLAGVTSHKATLLRDEVRVYVFGAEPYDAYAEAFSIENGDVVFRFCTSLWPDTCEEVSDLRQNEDD